MTIDELINKVNDSWGWAFIELCRTGDGQWRAFFQVVDVMDGSGDRYLEQPWFRHEYPAAALRNLVEWFRGKRVRHPGAMGGPGGSWVDVPMDLEFLSL